MSNKRLIYSDMFEDDEFGGMPIPVRLLWIGLIACMADDQGRLLENSTLIRSKVFAYDLEISVEDINQWLDLLVENGMLIRYTAKGKRLLQIRTWWKYQKPSWAQESKYPPCQGWTDRIKVHSTGNKVKMDNWDKAGGLTESDIKGEVNTDTDIDTDINININIKPTALPTALPTNIHRKGKEKGKEYIQVYEEMTGIKPEITSVERGLIERLEKQGVTPEEYRQAIQEMQSAKYVIANMGSVETWALNKHHHAKANGIDYEKYRILAEKQKEQKNV